MDLSGAEPNKPVILVGGLNGEGKTTLLEGIQLALYGRSSEIWKHNGRSYSEYLAQSIHRGSDPAGGALIEIEFEAIDQAELKSIKVQRSWRINGKDKVLEHSQVFVNGVLDELLSESWLDHVERFIPARLAGLFFFDGEKIRHYADPQRSQELLEKGILSLLGIDLIDQLSIDLRALERDITKSVKSDKRDKLILQLKETRNSRQTETEDLAQRIASLHNDLDQKKKECATLDRQYEKQGGRLFEKRIKFETSLGACKEKRSNIVKALIELSASELPLALLRGPLFNCKTQMEIELHVARAKVNKSAVEGQKKRLKRLLKSKRVAAKTLDLVSSFYTKELRELREMTNFPTYLGTNELDFLNTSQLIDTGIPNSLDNGVTLLDGLEKVDAEIQSLDRKLASVPDDESLAELIMQRDTASRELAIIEGRILQLEEDRRIAKVHLDEAESTLHKHLIKQLEKSQALKGNARALTHAESVRKTLIAFRSRLIDRRLELLQDTIYEAYSSLMRKKGMVANLLIDPSTFSLTLQNKSGHVIPPDWLSAGERQLLVVSILWGLARASGKALPVIVDTPVGRLDSTHRDNLVRHYFPHASHQVVLLSTDEEIVGLTLRNLESSIAQTYRLLFHDKTESTIIEPGYFVEQEHAN